MSYVDALQRISEIQAQLAPLVGGTAAAPAAATAASSPTAGIASLGSPSGASLGGPSFANVLSQAAQPQALPAGAVSRMTAGQQRFASQLAAETGLDSGVISSWMLAEESDGAARSREQANNHNWLNIGYTDSGTYGASASIWSDPVSAAHATAGWLRGQDTIDGYGRASAGVQSILNSAGQPPMSQIAALQRSGWASSGYPDLPGLYQQLTTG